MVQTEKASHCHLLHYSIIPIQWCRSISTCLSGLGAPSPGPFFLLQPKHLPSHQPWLLHEKQEAGLKSHSLGWHFPGGSAGSLGRCVWSLRQHDLSRYAPLLFNCAMLCSSAACQILLQVDETRATSFSCSWSY